MADIDLDGIPSACKKSSHRVSRDQRRWSCHLEWSVAEVNNGFGGYAAPANFVDNTKPPYDTVSDANYPNDKDYPEVAIINRGEFVLVHGATGKVMKSPSMG
ncbi:MAG: hypothetical protein R3C68_14220 [Myxococcota bacterium]